MEKFAILRKLKPFFAFLLMLLLVHMPMYSFSVEEDAAEAVEGMLLTRLERGDLLPSFSMKSYAGGRVVEAGRLKGKPSVLLFFAFDNDSRRKRSKGMIAATAELQRTFGDRVRFLGVLSDPAGPGEEAATLKEAGLEVLNDEERKAYADFGVFMMPVALLFSSDGKLVERVPFNAAYGQTLEAWTRVALGEIPADKVAGMLAGPKQVEKSAAEKEYLKLLNLARVLTQRKMFPQAIEQYRAAAALLPGEVTASRESGFVYLKAKDAVQAEKEFRKVLALQENDVAAVSGLGLALHAQGKDDEAFGELQDAAATVRPLPRVLAALAEIHLARGQKEEALAMYRKAVERYGVDLDRCGSEDAAP